jgi:flagellar basal body-associated protein FliL
MRKYCIVITLLVIFTLNGCTTPKSVIPVTGIEVTQTAFSKDSKTVVDTSTALMKHLDAYSMLSNPLPTIVTPVTPVTPGVKGAKTSTVTTPATSTTSAIDNLKLARSEAQTINEAGQRIFSYVALYERFIKEAGKANDAIIDLQAKLKKSNEAATQKQKELLVIAFGLSLVGLFLGVFMTVFGSKTFGISLAIGSLICLTLSVALQAYIAIVAVVGGVILALGLAYIVYMFIHNKNKAKQTHKELVETGQVLITKGWTVATKAEIRKIQSQDTKDIVEQVKSTLVKNSEVV